MLFQRKRRLAGESRSSTTELGTSSGGFSRETRILRVAVKARLALDSGGQRRVAPSDAACMKVRPSVPWAKSAWICLVCKLRRAASSHVQPVQCWNRPPRHCLTKRLVEPRLLKSRCSSQRIGRATGGWLLLFASFTFWHTGLRSLSLDP